MLGWPQPRGAAPVCQPEASNPLVFQVAAGAAVWNQYDQSAAFAVISVCTVGGAGAVLAITTGELAERFPAASAARTKYLVVASATGSATVRAVVVATTLSLRRTS